MAVQFSSIIGGWWRAKGALVFVIIIVVVFVVRGFLATTQILIKLAKQLDVRRRLIKVEIICIKS